MKTLFKILRSILTSLLFLCMTFGIIVQFSFTCFHKSPQRVPDYIDREAILDSALEEKTVSKETRAVLLEYVDNYIDYVFYKRSYPSIQTVDYNSLPEGEISYAKTLVQTLNKKIDIEYDTIVKIRSINNLISNGAIFLMINIGLFIIFLITLILLRNLKKSLLILGLSTIIGTLLSLIGSIILASNIKKWLAAPTYAVLHSILDKKFLSGIHAQALIYIVIGLIIFLTTYIYSKRDLFKRQYSTK